MIFIGVLFLLLTLLWNVLSITAEESVLKGSGMALNSLNEVHTRLLLGSSSLSELHKETSTEILTHELDKQAEKLSYELREFLVRITNETHEKIDSEFPFVSSTYVTSEDEEFTICENIKPVTELEAILRVFKALEKKANETNTTISESPEADTSHLTNVSKAFYYRIEVNPWKKEKLSKCIKKGAKRNVLRMEIGHHLSIQIACLNSTVTPVTVRGNQTAEAYNLEKNVLEDSLSDKVLFTSDLAFGERYKYDDLTGNTAEAFGGGFQWNLMNGALRIHESRVVTEEKEFELVFETKEALPMLLEHFKMKTKECYDQGILQIQVIHGGGWNEKVMSDSEDEEGETDEGIKEIVVGYGMDLTGYRNGTEGPETGKETGSYNETNSTDAEGTEKESIDVPEDSGGEESHIDQGNKGENVTAPSGSSSENHTSEIQPNGIYAQPSENHTHSMHPLHPSLNQSNGTASGPPGPGPLVSNSSSILARSYHIAGTDCLSQKEAKLCVILHENLQAYTNVLTPFHVEHFEGKVPSNELKSHTALSPMSSSLPGSAAFLISSLVLFCVVAVFFFTVYLVKMTTRRHGYHHIDRTVNTDSMTRLPF